MQRHRWIWLVSLSWVLTGCPAGDDDGFAGDDDTAVAGDDDAGDDDSAGGRVAIGWGVVDECGTPAEGGGFNPWYGAGEGVLVYGTSPQDAELAAQVAGWYGEWADFALRPCDELTEDDKQQNLFIVGGADTLPFLQELNGSLPVWFDELGFTFGGYRYDEPGHGLAMIHPSPFAAAAWLLLYVGNTYSGAYSTFTIWTGAEDVATTRGTGTLQQEGSLCRTGDAWGFYPDYVEDFRADWEAWVASCEQTETENHVFLYLPDSEADQAMATLGPWQEERYDDILTMLEVEALDEKIRTYLYPDNDTKGDVTGNSGNGHANYLAFEVHEVYGNGVYAVGAHEDVHVVAWHRIGSTNYSVMGEGLAVMVDGGWWGETLEYWVAYYRDEGTLPALSELIDDFWGYDDLITYPVSGHFVDYLRTTYGIDVVKEIYGVENLEYAFSTELGLSISELEQAWLATVP